MQGEHHPTLHRSPALAQHLVGRIENGEWRVVVASHGDDCRVGLDADTSGYNPITGDWGSKFDGKRCTLMSGRESGVGLGVLEPLAPRGEPNILLFKPDDDVLILSELEIVNPSPPVDTDQAVFFCRIQQGLVGDALLEAASIANNGDQPLGLLCELVADYLEAGVDQCGRSRNVELPSRNPE